jgi:hypothetical protein
MKVYELNEEYEERFRLEDLRSYLSSISYSFAIRGSVQ